jgi:hypothetical protein
MAKYLLHVDLIVAESNAAAFEVKVDEFLKTGSFGRLGAELRSEFVLGLKSSAFTYTGYETYEAPEKSVERRDGRVTPRTSQAGTGVSVIRYVHLWRIPSPDLAPAMSASADDKLYVELDDLVIREIQNLVMPVPRFGLFKPPSGPKFLRVSRKLPSGNLGAYLFKSGALTTALEEQGWHLLHQLQNVTGPLNTVTEFWQIPEDGTHASGEPGRVLQGLNPSLKKNLLEGPEGVGNLPLAEVRESLYEPVYFKKEKERQRNAPAVNG